MPSGGSVHASRVAVNASPLREHTRLADPVIEIVVKMKLDQVELRGVENMLPSELSGRMRIADRVAIMRDGSLVEIGTPGQLVESSHPYVRQFLERRHDEPAEKPRLF